jgi:phosphohistidine phosphatase
MRHGEALSASENSERPLSIHGQEDVARLAQYLKACDIQIPQILHSPRARAKQTATIVSEAMDNSRLVEAEHGLDEADALDYVLEQIPNWHEDTLLVGHLPFMSQLVSQLVLHNPDSPIVTFAPATIVCLEPLEAQRWIVKWSVSPQIMIPPLAADQARDMF